MARSNVLVAVATARGSAERGIVRVSGADAFEVVGARFRPASGRAESPQVRAASAGVFSLRRIGAAAAAEAWRFPGPRSYTGEDMVELHLLGAPALLAAVARELIDAGAAPAGPGDFTRRALLNGKMDLTRAEAVVAVIAATNDAELRRAAALLDGGLARDVATLVDRLLDLLVPLELALDFSDQDVTIITPDDHGLRISELAADVRSRASAAPAAGRRLAPRVVLRGPANAGKSTLFNRLIGRDAAITSSIPGATRDVLTAERAFGAVRATLVDTAGDDVYESALDAAARRMRERALREADLVLEIRDLRDDPARRTAAVPTLHIGTKADLAGAAAPGAAGVLRVSALTGEGVAELEAAIESALLRAPSASAAPVASARAAAAFAEAAAALDAASAAVSEHPPEFAASDLRAALRALHSISHAPPDDPVLDRIFGGYCIGK